MQTPLDCGKIVELNITHHRRRSIFSIPVDELLDKLPAGKLEQTVEAFVAPMAASAARSASATGGVADRAGHLGCSDTSGHRYGSKCVSAGSRDLTCCQAHLSLVA